LSLAFVGNHYTPTSTLYRDTYLQGLWKMYDPIQTALTATVEAIAIVAAVGLPAHYIIMSHIREVQSWGTPHTTPAQEVKPEAKPEVKPEAKPEVKPEAKPEVKPEAKPEVKPEAKPEVKPEAKPEVKPEVKAVAIEQPEAEAVTEVVPVVEVVKEVVKPCKTRSKKAPQPKLQPISVGAAAVDYAAMTSEQLRKECALQGIEWRTGGDYGKPMKKAQMLAALR
jgi:outer membrane biosynthesis protein TonB